ncbi:MAG: hypothetical protein ABSC29_02955 [Minisyncoccia bacterium]
MKKEVPFPLGCAVVFAVAFFAFEIIFPSLAMVGGAVGAVPVTPAPQWQIATVAQNTVVLSASLTTFLLAPASSTASSSAISSSTLSSSTVSSSIQIATGLLPKVTLLAQKTVDKPKSTPKKATQTAQPKPIATAAPITVTAQSFLDATTLSLKEQPDGPYEVVLTTNAGAGKNTVWGLDAATLGGSSSLPPFSVSFLCDPPPIMPAPDMSDQNPIFSVRTSYHCTITLTPLSGNDERPRSRTFSFATGPGQFIITRSLAMNTLLTNNKNTGGFVFKNQDANTITVTALNLAISYTALNVNGANGPFVLRFLDPVTEAPLADYPLENLPANPSLSYTQNADDITIPLSFAVAPGTQKMLPLVVLGVNRMQMSGIDPKITITIHKLTTDQSDARIMLNAAQITWHCVVPVGAYDPNATSGPFATGEACQ